MHHRRSKSELRGWLEGLVGCTDRECVVVVVAAVGAVAKADTDGAATAARVDEAIAVVVAAVDGVGALAVADVVSATTGDAANVFAFEEIAEMLATPPINASAPIAANAIGALFLEVCEVVEGPAVDDTGCSVV
ncbi:MAG: hypothetical protein ABI461_18395 [Polyangiaceae bacterium]